MNVAHAVQQTNDLLRQDLDMRGQVHDHERRLSAVEQRLGR